MTDVPGHTRAIIPLLANAGIQYLHIGVNAFSPPPDVPDVFRWQHPDGTDLIVQYHKDDYGITSALPGDDVAISFAHTGDNQGPQSAADVQAVFARLQEQFPDAKLVGSDLNAYAKHLLAKREQLPIVTPEIGDTWIHGVGTDPQKVAGFRTLSRLRRHWQETGKLDADSGMTRALLCIPEHTWGMSRASLDDYLHYAKDDLAGLRQQERCQRVEASWTEQREYLNTALDALPDKLRREAEAALATLHPQRPEATTLDPLDLMGLIKTRFFDLGFDEKTGALKFLIRHDGDRHHAWAFPGHELALFHYQIFAQETCEQFAQQYGRNWPKTAAWGPISFARPDFDPAGIIADQIFTPTFKAAFKADADGAVQYLTQAEMPERAVAEFGCPREIWIRYTIPDRQPEIRIELQCFDRQASRLPDAMWFSFMPKIVNYGGWELDKMGDWTSPHDVVQNGNRRLHAVQTGARYRGPEGTLAIETLDAPLLAPGRPRLYDFSGDQPQMQHGIHFNLWNNWWNTNFPYWNEDHAKFRFTLKLEDPER